MNSIKDPNELRAVYGTPKERALLKVIPHLDRHCARFVSLSPFCVVGTTDSKGRPDVSPRGGAPGFVKVLDSHTLLLPDRPGNNRLDSLSNLTNNRSIVLMFLVPGIDESLRVYGSAEVIVDPEISRKLKENGREPKVLLRIHVEQVYFQCAKALLRAKMWAPEAKVERSSFPALGEILKEQMQSDAPAEPQEIMLQRYQKDL
jgi:uncharacterized protein